jgi:hypothetical protein
MKEDPSMALEILRTALLGITAGALVVGPLMYSSPADARGYRGYARTNVGVNRGVSRNFDRNVNVNRNLDVNRNVNVDVDRRGWGYGYHPVATGVAVGATAAVTAAVIGSVVYSLPPSCTSVIINGISYQQCGSTWYQPQYAGSNVSYTVVNPPR